MQQKMVLSDTNSKRERGRERGRGRGRGREGEGERGRGRERESVLQKDESTGDEPPAHTVVLAPPTQSTHWSAGSTFLFLSASTIR